MAAGFGAAGDELLFHAGGVRPQVVGEVHVTRNMKVIEWPKADVSPAVTSLYRGMVHGGGDVMLDSPAGFIITWYLLGRRFGFSRPDSRVEAGLKQGVGTGHEIQEWFGFSVPPSAPGRQESGCKGPCPSGTVLVARW